MEPVAVNRITITRELFAESHAAIFSKKRQKTLLCCGIVFFAFGLILLAVQMRLPVASALSFPALLSGAIVVVWALTLQKTELRRKYNAFRRRNGDASERVVRCGRNSLTVETGSAQPVEIDYPDIREHRETEHLYLLICSNHTGVMLAKDGFENGSWQALLDAIERAKAEAQAALELLEG